ncbi:MAG TPA: response regulator transcription factor [Iamia sp.]|nr:response regulator transcription factor [Iamia sp.]
MRILLLEDDAVLRRSLARRLRADGLAVDEAATLAAARAALWNVRYDGLVLDRLVPDGDGLDLVVELRGRRERARVLVLSALGHTDERVRGLRAGADDYMAKPVGLDELSLRVTNLLVRTPLAEQVGPLIELGRVVIDRSRRQVAIDGETAHLTPIQYALVEYLAVHRCRVVSSDELLEHCWDANRDLLSNPLYPQLSRLRAVFGDALAFVSVRGQGYLLRCGDET